MISHVDKCVFIHIRKSAGSSVKKLLTDPDEKLNEGVLSSDWKRLVDDKYSDYFRFAIIRNPWDRFVSGWRYCESTRGQDMKEVLDNLPAEDMRENVLSLSATKKSRASYLKVLLKNEREIASYLALKDVGMANFGGRNKPRKIGGHDFRHLTRTQTAYLLDEYGRVVVDRIFSVENISNDVVELSWVLNKGFNEFPHLNKSRLNSIRSDDYRELFDSEAREIFYLKFQEDVDLLGYKFDDGPGALPESPYASCEWSRH